METAYLVKYGMIVVGIVIILAGFWFHSIKKMTVNFSVVWEFLGVILIIIGSVPVLSAWTRLISAGTGFALFCLGTICLMGGFQFSLLVSQLTMKNQELAIQVSLLNQENERILFELEEIHKRKDREDLSGEERTGNEENPVCN